MAVVGAAAALLPLTVKASWDTGPKPTPKPNLFPFPLKKHKPIQIKTATTTPTQTKTPKKKKKHNSISVKEILKTNPKQEKAEEGLYLGYERWLPAAPEVKNPRSIYNAATLAYIGDSIFELYARRHFLFPPLNIDEYNERVMAVVRCEAQDALLKKLLSEDYLSEDERDILRWGKNIDSGRTRTVKRAGVAVYSRASSLETLVGYLYLTNVTRLDDLMLKLGFSTSASGPLIGGAC